MMVAPVSACAAETPPIWVATIHPAAPDAYGWTIRVNIWAPTRHTEKAERVAWTTGEGPDGTYRQSVYDTAVKAMDALARQFPGMWFVPRIAACGGFGADCFGAMVPA